MSLATMVIEASAPPAKIWPLASVSGGTWCAGLTLPVTDRNTVPEVA